MINRSIYLILFLFLSSTVFAQEVGNKNAVDQMMYADGKIYVVAACLFIIFAGVLIYLVLLDRKVKRLEKKYGER